jgi:hypothetical protein
MNKDAKIYIAGHNEWWVARSENLPLKANQLDWSFEQGTGSEKPTSRKDFMAAENRK